MRVGGPNGSLESEMAFAFWSSLWDTGLMPERFDAQEVMQAARDQFRSIEEVSKFHDRCLCGKQLDAHNFIVRTPQGQGFLIGSSCINKFAGNGTAEAVRKGQWCSTHGEKIDRRTAAGKEGRCKTCEFEHSFPLCPDCNDRRPSHMPRCAVCEHSRTHDECQGCGKEKLQTHEFCSMCKRPIYTKNGYEGTFIEVFRKNLKLTRWFLNRTKAHGWVVNFQEHAQLMRNIPADTGLGSQDLVAELAYFK
jgi:hypothetical protein